ncbi:hypothetical protein C8R47DRAFT_54665 [Mycena vitilis]|nr:hypothetical protein C8R47DRAFT_54665 [Mycena vitilis]
MTHTECLMKQKFPRKSTRPPGSTLRKLIVYSLNPHCRTRSAFSAVRPYSSATSVQITQPGQLMTDQYLKAQLNAQLRFDRELVQLETAFLAIDSDGPPHSLSVTCENPVPLGTPKMIWKHTTSNTVGGTAGVTGGTVAVGGTTSITLGAEHGEENQLPPRTAYMSHVCASRIVGETFKIIPCSEGNDETMRPSRISVNLTSEVDVAIESRRGKGYKVLLSFTAQWHLRQRCGEPNHQFGYYYLVLHEATEDVWGAGGDGTGLKQRRVRYRGQRPTKGLRTTL